MTNTDDLIGKSLDEAKQLLTGSKKRIFVSRNEEKTFVCTADIDESRIKVDIANGKIVSARVG